LSVAHGSLAPRRLLRRIARGSMESAHRSWPAADEVAAKSGRPLLRGGRT